MSILDAFLALYNVVDRFNTENSIYEIQSKPALWNMFSPLFADKGAKNKAGWKLQTFSSKMKMPTTEFQKCSNTISRCWKWWKKIIDDKIV